MHGEPLGADETKATKEANGWPLDKPFYVPDEVRALWDKRKGELQKIHAQWNEHEKKWLGEHAKEAELYRAMRDKSMPADLLAQLAAAAPAKTDATRGLAGTIMQKAAALVPSLVGGDADLGGSTKTPIKDSPKVQAGKFEGRNLRFGIREHAMGAMANGFAYYGMYIPFTATFLTFSDYMRPAIRLAALSRLQVVHVFTHDSVFLGEDGPTHQSVEHVSALRLIPHVHVWRPADARRVRGRVGRGARAQRRTDRADPVAPEGRRAAAGHQGRRRAARRLRHPARRERHARRRVSGDGLRGRHRGRSGARARQRRHARARRLACLASRSSRRKTRAGATACCRRRACACRSKPAAPTLWKSWVGADGITIGVDDFGHSAPYEVIADHLGFTGAKVAARVRERLTRK